MKNRSGIIWSFVFFIVMAGCSGANQQLAGSNAGVALKAPENPASNQAEVEINAVSEDAGGYQVRPVDIEIEEGRAYLPMGAEFISKEGKVDLADVIKALADHKGYSVSWADDVQNKPVGCYIKAADNFYDALDNVLRPLDYFYEIEGDTIVVRYKEVRRYHIAIPDFSEAFDTSLGGDMLGGSSATSTGMSASATLSGQTEVSFWDDIEASLGKVVVCEGCASPIINRSLGIITVTAPQRIQEAVKDHLDLLQNEAYKQVVIEAKIIEVALSEGHQTGIDWSSVLGNGIGLTANLTPDGQLWSKDGGWDRFLDSIVLDDTSWSVVVHAFETYGDVRLVANPKIHVLNGRGALINVTENSEYVSEVTVTVSGDSGAMSTSVTTSEISEGLSLAVKASIINDEEVMLYVFPTVARLLGDFTTFDFGDGEVQLADTAVRQMSTYAKVKNNSFLVIGGLVDSSEDTVTSKVPVLGDIPFLGEYLFSYEQTIKETTELVILLKPRILPNSLVVTSLP